MKVGETVSVVTMSGEYVGKLKSLEPLTLEDPRMIIQTGEGKMGFAKGIAVTGVIDPKEQIFNQYVFVCKTNKCMCIRRTLVCSVRNSHCKTKDCELNDLKRRL